MPATTQILRLIMNGSAGLKVVILYELAGQVGHLLERAQQQLEHAGC